MGKNYLIKKLARVIVFMLTAVFGVEATQVDSIALEVAGLLVTAGIAVITFLISMNKDKALLETEPPKK